MKTNPVIATVIAAMMSGALILPLRAQITVGGDGANTTDSTSYSGAQSLTKIGSNTVTLTGASTYTGGTTINAGALAIGAANRLPDVGAVTINSGGVFGMGSFGDYIGSLTMNGNATVAGTSGTGGGQFILTTGQATNSTIKTLTASGTNNAINVNIGISSQWGGVGGNANLHFDVVGASDHLTVSGVIADQSFDGGGNATSGAITKTGQGTLVLLGNNSYSGGAVISSGTIQVGNGGTTGNITGNDAAIVNNGTLIINRGGGFGLGNAISGSGSLVQAGAGTTTLSGNNSYTGGTTINAGSLLLGSANRLADSGALAVNGGNFNLGGFSETVGAVTVAGGSITNGTLTGSSYDMQSGTVSAVLAGNGALTKTTAGTATLSGANTYTGGTTVSTGRLATTGHERLADTGAVTVNSGGTLAVGGNETIGSIAGNGSVVLSGRLTTGASSSTFGGAMSGIGGLTKNGAGTFTLSGASTYTGDTILSGGTLVLNSANALWTGGVLSMDAGTTLTVNQRTFIGALDQGSGTVNGPGELVATLTLTESGALNAVLADGTDFAAGILKRTSGTTTIGADNTFTGGINVQGGTLQLGAGGSFDAASSLALSSGATMDLGNKAQTFSAVSGLGGTVAMGSGALTVNGNNDSVFAGAITGTGPFTKSGSGTVTLSGNNTYTGGTVVNAGELNVNGSIAGGAVTVSSGASLSGSGTVGAISGAGAINPGNSPGILTAPSVNPSDGLSFNFEFSSLNPTYSNASASLNDVLRLTAATPFTESLTSLNVVKIFFNVDVFEEGQLYTGGFFTDAQGGFLDEIVNASFNYYVKDASGTFSYGGQTYAALGAGLAIDLTTINQSADFAGGDINGQVVQFEVIPEPSTYALLVLGAAALGSHAWRKRRRAQGV
jgi:fibronectin-binding autotransporter adhesin